MVDKPSRFVALGVRYPINHPGILQGVFESHHSPGLAIRCGCFPSRSCDKGLVYGYSCSSGFHANEVFAGEFFCIQSLPTVHEVSCVESLLLLYTKKFTVHEISCLFAKSPVYEISSLRNFLFTISPAYEVLCSRNILFTKSSVYEISSLRGLSFT